jgi:predicted O-methyltransferase YrrM
MVRAARSAAAEAGFEYSSDDRVGRLLSVLAGAVPRDGRTLELGPRAGVGTAWLVHGLGERLDIEVITGEADPATAALAQRQVWPAYVRFIVDDAARVLPSLAGSSFSSPTRKAASGSVRISRSTTSMAAACS